MDIRCIVVGNLLHQHLVVSLLSLNVPDGNVDGCNGIVSLSLSVSDGIVDGCNDVVRDLEAKPPR